MILRVKFEGRLGNQLFQYVYARTLATRLAASLEVPAWEGASLLKLMHSPTSTSDALEVCGFFQRPDCLAAYSRQELQSWFNLDAPGIDKGLICVHLRQGDITNHKTGHLPIARAAYDRCLARLGLTWDQVTVISEETASSRTPSGAIPDFLRMVQAKVLIRANSSYSWWAAVLGNAKVYSPRVFVMDTAGDCYFEEGNHNGFLQNQPDLIVPP